MQCNFFVLFFFPFHEVVFRLFNLYFNSQIKFCTTCYEVNVAAVIFSNCRNRITAAARVDARCLVGTCPGGVERSEAASCFAVLFSQPHNRAAAETVRRGASDRNR